MLRYVVAVLIAAVAVLIATQDTPPMVSPITSETLPRKSIEMLRLGLAFGFGALSEALMPEKLRLLHLHFGFVDTQAFHVFATLEVADAMHEGLDTASALAARVGADETRLEQVLQYLAARGVIVHKSDGTYKLKEGGDLLRRGRSGSLWGAAVCIGAAKFVAWSRLADAVVADSGSAFALAHGVEHFEWHKERPAMNAAFDHFMTGLHRTDALAVTAAYDFGGECETVADIGGGAGGLAFEIAAAHSAVSRVVVVDQPQVSASFDAFREGVAAAADYPVEFQGGNFFQAETLPQGLACYAAMHVLHNWGDEDAARILDSVRFAMRPDSKLVIFETVLPEVVAPDPINVIKFNAALNMLVWHGAGERTASRWTALLESTNFTLTDITPTRNPMLSLIVATPRHPN